ncbi:hypothetical protein H6P81_006405 [Aristolochia fimbriata]|uniref:Aminotransferase-like plant mobile domain-containing protein n=1 Tax=Aristolochia fimbriata TaxID=158543 RepID=A0AAV7EYF2_ARIFI|nr:hypothetical protein H6P81_006405 [Aristolochia fimbriata]
MASPSVTLVGGVRAFDHVVVVGGETVQTLALFMEGDASHMTYCPSGESIFGDHAEKPSPLMDRSRSCEFLSRRLTTSDRVFFLPCPDSPEREDEAAEPETLGELSITLMDMDRIFALPIAGQFYDEISPMVADFTDVRSTDLPFSCRYLFLAYHHLCRCSGSNVVSIAAWVEFWLCTEDDVVPVDDPWTAWYARYGRDAPPYREYTTTERDVFHFLHVTPSKEDEVHLAALLSVWLSRFVFRSIGDELRPMVFKVASYMATGVRFALAGPALANLCKGLGHTAAGWPSMAQWPYLYTWLAVYFHTHGEDLEGSRRPGMISFGNPSLRRDFTEEQACDLFRRLPQNRLESAPVVSAIENSDEDYDSDRSHPRKRRPSGKRPVGASSVSKKSAPLTTLADVSGSASKKKKACKEVPTASFPFSPPTFLPPISETEPQISCLSGHPPVETVRILSSPEAPGVLQEEASSPGAIAQTISSVVVIPEDTEVVEEPVEITPALTQPETLPVQEVAPSPSVVQEEAEEEVVEEVPAIEEVAEDAPAVEEASVVQDLPPPILTSQEAPSQEFLSYVEGLMLQAWKDRIVPRMLSPGAVSDTSLLADVGFAISRLQEMGHDVTRLRVYTQQPLRLLRKSKVKFGEKARRTSGMRQRVLLETLWP